MLASNLADAELARILADVYRSSGKRAAELEWRLQYSQLPRNRQDAIWEEFHKQILP